MYPAFEYSALDVVVMGRAGRIAFFESPKKADYERARAALDMLGIPEFADKDYTRLSGGERQLVLIARAICQGADIIMMDEPMQSLDFINQSMVQHAARLLVQQGHIVIMSTHTAINNYEENDKTLLMSKDGTAVFGAIEETMTQKKRRKSVWYSSADNIQRRQEGGQAHNMSAAGLMNVFLTGGSNAGKSWIIDKFLEQYGGTVGGYKTVLAKTDIDKMCGIYLLDINKQDEPLSYNNRVGSCAIDRNPIGYKEVFETIGVAALEKTPRPSLIVMDEVGVLENGCPNFKISVLSCLDSQADVLGVLKKKSSDLIDSIRARNDIYLIDLGLTNQSEAFRRLKEYLC